LAMSAVAVTGAAGQEVVEGEWELTVVGRSNPVRFRFRDDGTMVAAEAPEYAYDEVEVSTYNTATQTFSNPIIGKFRYSLTIDDRIEVFLGDVDESHPMVQAFAGANASNGVEKEFYGAIAEALIEVLQTTPFMVGRRVEGPKAD